MALSTFVLYALAFVSGAFILIVVCAVIGAYLDLRYNLLDYKWPTDEKEDEDEDEDEDEEKKEKEKEKEKEKLV